MKLELSPGMAAAFEEAEAAFARGEVPVGAAITAPDGRVIARAGNHTRAGNDPTAHAEMLVIREACQIVKSERLTGHDLHVTLEPCPMCAAAISAARIGRLYYGAGDEKMGGVDHGARVFAASSCHHRPEVYAGLGESRAVKLLTEFFKARR